ncbi:MAG: DUF2312 domain-containing protein [Nitrospira sp.]|nr:DUF2312 domain-containing protein [Nitrospira sp.]
MQHEIQKTTQQQLRSFIERIERMEEEKRRADDIRDPDLRAAWQRLQGLHEELRPLVREFERRLGTAA